jgi:mRNA interferase MazF
MEVAQRDVWWADLGDPVGSTAGHRRPVIIVQGDELNASRTSTFLCIPLTRNLRWENFSANLRIAAGTTGLEHDSVAQVALMFTANESELLERVGRISQRQLEQLLARLDLALGRG